MSAKTSTSSGTESPHPGLTTILVIEDDQPIRSLIRRMLEFEGFAVLEASDGIAGLSLMEAMEAAVRPIDLVVTDFELPGIRGDIVATLLRHRLPELPVLCISGNPKMAIPALPHEDLTHFLEKPFSAAGLIQHIRELLAASH